MSDLLYKKIVIGIGLDSSKAHQSVEALQNRTRDLWLWGFGAWGDEEEIHTILVKRERVERKKENQRDFAQFKDFGVVGLYYALADDFCVLLRLST